MSARLDALWAKAVDAGCQLYAGRDDFSPRIGPELNHTLVGIEADMEAAYEVGDVEAFVEHSARWVGAVADACGLLEVGA